METIMGSRKGRAGDTAVQRSGESGMVILPWTKQILGVLWEHLRLLVHVIYYSFLAVFQMFRLEVHFRITDETGHRVQHMNSSDSPAESFILSSLFDGTNTLAKCGVDAYAGSSHAGALLSGLRSEGLCCSLVDDFVMRATECFSESDDDLCLGHHPSWHSSDSDNWDIYVAPDCDRTPDVCHEFHTPVEVFEPTPKSESIKDLEESPWDDDDSDEGSSYEKSQAVWESFTQSCDPYNPLCFSACMSTSSKKEFTQEGEESGSLEKADSCSTCREENPQNVSQKTCSEEMGHVSSDSESGWDSSGESSPDEDVENQKLWDSFSRPADPYNPLQFTARACSSGRVSPGGVSHGEKTPAPVGHESDDQEDSSPEDDLAGSCEDDEPHCSEEDELWNSFSQHHDPYHPLHFRACLRSSQPPRGTVTSDPWLTNENVWPQGSQRARRSKPPLPNRHFKHYCPQRSCDSPKMVPWKKGKEGSGIPVGALKTDKPPVKKVRFSPIVQVHVMRAWSSALQASRRGPWEEMARDRDRFQRRILEAEQSIGYCLHPSHREKILASMWNT